MAQHVKKLFEMGIGGVLRTRCSSINRNSFRARTSQVEIRDTGWVGGGGEGGVHPDPDIRGGRPQNFFGPLGLILF